MKDIDAAVIGSGPNGLAAAVTMARAGLRVVVFEHEQSSGGACRTEEMTLPGILHDTGAAVHPMALASSFFRSFGLRDRIRIHIPELSYAHPLDGGTAGLAYRDIERTSEVLGKDGPSWLSLFGPLIDQIEALTSLTTGSLLQLPKDPTMAVRLGWRTLEQGSRLHRMRFSGHEAPAMLAGTSAHTIGRMPALSTAAAGLVLAAHAHAGGWGVPAGGSQTIINALADDLLAHGGHIEHGHRINSIDELGEVNTVLADVSVPTLSGLAHFPPRYLRALARYRRGNAAAKVDFVLSEPPPWKNGEISDAAVVHLGGTAGEIAASENTVAAGRHPENPYVLVAQPSVHDKSRAPTGQHVLWSYTHVPNGSRRDMTNAITAQIERFAPGFRDTIIASVAHSAEQIGEFHSNMLGGDIAGGAVNMAQLLRRPILSRVPWRTPVQGLYLCSASTPPGPSVHGMAGWHAARTALADRFGIHEAPDLKP